MKIPSSKQIVKDIDSYLKKHNMRAHVFGRDVLNDSGAVFRLRDGRNPRLSTVEKIYKKINQKN